MEQVLGASLTAYRIVFSVRNATRREAPLCNAHGCSVEAVTRVSSKAFGADIAFSGAMNQKPTPHLNETSRKLVRNVRDAAKTSVAAYLEVARVGGLPQRKQALEAVAVERAVLSEALGDLAGDSVSADENPQNVSAPVSVLEADKKLYAASDRLYRKCEDAGVKRLARDLRVSVFGLSAEQVPCR